MRVDIWSDIVCPWCYIGKRRFEQGLGQFGHAGDVEVVYHAFELDPSIPAGQVTPIGELLTAKYGMTADQARSAEASVAAQAQASGLRFTTSRLTGNTFDAHRLVALGREAGRQDTILQFLYEAYFADGRSVFGSDDLVAIAEAAGLDGGRARAVLDGQEFADSVRADEDQARQLGISGVPFVVLDGRLGVSGAQPATTFTAALDQAWTSERQV
jgi:predicted DsbA family dithiol-disulfide isomerase